MEGVWATGKLRTNRGFIQMNKYSSILFRKIKKFLDKNPREEENLKTFPSARSLISNESPNSISTNRREEDSKRTFANTRIEYIRC